jgi:beta-xylosidase
VATLSNGWAPYFSGQAGCVMALDATCPDDTGCTTRIGYGPAWIPAPNHPNFYDDVAGRVFWERGDCTNTGGNSYARLSNGWTPTFSGNNACDVSFRYTGCGGLYANSILDACADPGVLLDGSTYVLTCTSGNAANAFPIRTSTDLVSWTSHGSIFPSGHHPAWAASDFWAPEIHKVGSHYVAYFTARGSDGVLAVGAATASAATGPFTDLGHALVHDASMGMIDPTEFTSADGTPYLVWKADGNAVGQHTPIYGQQLTADGTALTGTRHTLITNDEGWEGGVVEGPWVVLHDGSYFLFYSGNSYANATYAVGVAKASSPLGTYSKLGSPILTSDTPWKGPGHCSVVSAPSGNTVMVYHAWQAGHVNGAGDSRHLLIDPVQWSGGWPSMPAAPSSTSRPLP